MAMSMLVMPWRGFMAVTSNGCAQIQIGLAKPQAQRGIAADIEKGKMPKPDEREAQQHDDVSRGIAPARDRRAAPAVTIQAPCCRARLEADRCCRQRARSETQCVRRPRGRMTAASERDLRGQGARPRR